MRYYFTPIVYDNGAFADIIEIYSKKFPGKFKNEEDEDAFCSKYHCGTIEIQKKNKKSLDSYLDDLIKGLSMLVKDFVSKDDADFYMRLNVTIDTDSKIIFDVVKFCSSSIPYGTLLMAKRIH